MLILNEQEVIYCQVVRPGRGKFGKLSGLAYNNRLFCKIESYPITEYKSAVNRARELFDEEQQQVIFLLVEEANAYTIWRHDQQLVSLKNFNASKDFHPPIDFLELLDKICETSSPAKKRVYEIKIKKLSG